MLITRTEILRELGATYAFLWDTFADRSGWRRRLSPDICWVCTAKRSVKTPLSVAHIESRYEGSSNERPNLIQLCNRRRNRQGCHDLFDQGYASALEMANARDGFVSGRRDACLREMMLQRHKQFMPPEYEIENPESHYYNEFREKEKLAAKAKAAGNDEQYYRLKLNAIKAQRMRIARGTLSKALTSFEDLPERQIPQAVRSLYCYEGGYLHLLHGNHGKARMLMQESLDTLDRNSQGWEAKHGITELVVIACKIMLKEGQTTWETVSRWIRTVEEVLERRINDIRSRGILDPRAHRTYANCKWDRVRAAITLGNLSAAKAAWIDANDLWRHMTLLEGWERTGFRRIKVETRGHIALMEARNHGGYEKAIGYLVKALQLNIKSIPRRPEGVRDILFAIAECLERLSYPKEAKKVSAVANRTLDGNSWMRPYSVSPSL